MLTKNDRRVLDAVYRTQHEHDWFVPHGPADWPGVKRLKAAGLMRFGGDGACTTCPKMHNGMLYALTDAGEKLLGEVVG